MRLVEPVKTPTYRPDIDGLRAIAVAAVILFHADVPGFAGGFVGVDVFFVISGFLITQLLVARAGLPAMSVLREFYLRRARRILPALLFVLLACALAAWWLLLPNDLIRFGKYLGLSSIMAGNFAAWSEGDYFNSAVGFAPLLHLWSIAVEEQFYLLYPLALLASWRWWPRHLRMFLAAVGALSFALSLWGSVHHPVANFYLGPTRAWELLIGAGAAMLRVNDKRGAWVAGASLAVIVGAVVMFRRDFHHPGVVTLLPAFATAALLSTGRAHSAPAHRLLSWRPLVFTGLISYSLYLWHLPFIVFATYYSITALSGMAMTLLLVMVYAVSAASWAWIEQPIRRGTQCGANRLFVAVMAAGFALCAFAGLWVWNSDGLPQRFDPSLRPLIASANWHRDTLRCLTLPLTAIAAGDMCRYGSPDAAAPRVLLWGDSHALAMLPAHEKLAQSSGTQLHFAALSTCRPLPFHETPGADRAMQMDCDAFNDAMVRAAEVLRPKVVILNAFWDYPHARVTARAGARPSPGGEVPLAQALDATMQRLAAPGRRFCVVLDVPVRKHPLPYALVMAHRRGIGTEFLAAPEAASFARMRTLDRQFSGLSRADVLVVDPKRALCREGRCETERDHQALYRDSNHLSIAGAEFVVSSLAPCFDAAR